MEITASTLKYCKNMRNKALKCIIFARKVIYKRLKSRLHCNGISRNYRNSMNGINKDGRNRRTVEALVDVYISSIKIPPLSNNEVYNLTIDTLTRISKMNPQTKLHRLLENYSHEMA
ncbi:hypothetical protein K501DRAFT_271568 [Backusella circina FSU 941]|nr:hypothetical protein K501DRAFT_271568 [Backusella circina FSU 941]